MTHQPPRTPSDPPGDPPEVPARQHANPWPQGAPGGAEPPAPADAAPESPPSPGPPPGAPTRGPRTVRCAKLGEELPGLAAPPFATPLGDRIFATISSQAWNEWLLHSQRVINERGLNLADPQARAAWMQECEVFLFGGGAPPPPGWVPPAGFVRLDIDKGRNK